MSYDQEVAVMMSTARQAGELALKHFRSGRVVEEKEDRSPVTIADRECEELICRRIVETFPEDGITAEEGSSATSRSGRRWIVDPIDGTRDFVRGNQFWAVQIALEAAGRVVLGVIHFPCLNDTLFAASGAGCYWNQNKTTISDIRRLEKAILMISGLKSAWGAWGANAVRSLTEECWTVRSYGGSYDVAMLGRGMADIWLSGSGMEWDYAPGRIIAQEAGAVYLTNDGSDRIDAGNCLICTPGLELELRRILGIVSPG